jgi:hypothetical protein
MKWIALLLPAWFVLAAGCMRPDDTPAGRPRGGAENSHWELYPRAVLGEPMGASLMALSFSDNLSSPGWMGWGSDVTLGIGFVDGPAVHVSADLLTVPFAVGSDFGAFVWYVGPGVRFRVHDGAKRDDPIELGPRCVIGILVPGRGGKYIDVAPGYDVVHDKVTVDIDIGFVWTF